MGPTRERLQTAAALMRAAELGREIEVILGDTSLQRLSKDAWLRMAASLAGADLAELRAKVEGQPYLWRLAGSVAARWVRDQQDRPVADQVFASGQGDFAASYAERIVSSISVEQASAVVAVLVSELAPSTKWGKLTDFAEVPALIDPLRAELEALDDQLAAELRVRDLTWEAGRATLRAGAVSVALDAEASARPATAIALAARDAARGLQQAA